MNRATKAEIIFEQKCKAASEKFDADVFFCHGESYQLPFEDDGALHIVSKGGTGAVFDVNHGQDESGKVQNERTRKIMKFLKLNKFITDRVLVEECDEEDDDICPYCGR